MCDTMGFLAQGKAFFAKNSDRSPNEPQVLEYHPPGKGRGRLRTTYAEIEDAEETYAALLSRPIWLWGAEMGVNECGLAIGNEAVFTKGAYGKAGLTGMDLLRLALERAEDAKGAVAVITELLERYGQGGNCGYDHAFYYDNSFLIIDRENLFTLETAGKRWAVKRHRRAAISNRLSIGADAILCDRDTPPGADFKKTHLEPVYSFFSGSKQRNAAASGLLESASGAADLARTLRSHAPGAENPLCRNSVKSVCMHAGGAIGDHTTASMIVELGDVIKVYATGGSTPCVSLFKPFAPGNPAIPPVFARDDPAAKEYWLAHERFHRNLIGKKLPAEYYAGRDALEQSWFAEAETAGLSGMAALSVRAAEEEAAFYEKWSRFEFEPGKAGASFLNYWRKKDAALK